MDKLLKLKQAREAALARAEAAFAKAVGGVLAVADQAEFDAAHADIDRLDGEIKAAQKVVDDEATAAGAATRNAERMSAARASRGSRTTANATGETTPTAEGGRRAVITDVRQRSEDDRRRGFASLGELAMAIVAANPNLGGRADERLNPLAAAQGLNQAAGSDGGFLVPPEFAQAIWDGLNSPADSLLGMTDQYQVTGESLTFNANAETSRANGSRYGGVRAYWLNEADQLTKSAPKFRQMKLEPQGVAALIYVTDKLLRNAPALNAYLSKAALDEINFVIGDSIINGTGAGKPLGLLAAGGALVTVAAEGSQAATTLQQENVSKMWARLHPRCRANAVWLYNPDVEPQFDGLNTKIKNVAGTENVGGISNVVWNAEKRLLKGRPVIPVEFCPTLGTVGDIILTDLGMYATGVQGGVQADVSMHLRFDYAESCFRFITYVDGQPWLKSALTPYKGSNTLTSHVALAAR